MDGTITIHTLIHVNLRTDVFVQTVFYMPQLFEAGITDNSCTTVEYKSYFGNIHLHII